MSLEPDETPFPTFESWMAAAQETEDTDPTATALATVDAEGRPAVRMVLLKEWGPAGFVFYTNLESRKAQEIAANPRAALCIHWAKLRRQVRIEGDVHPVSDAEADAYFASRDRGSRIGAWASKQSRPLESPHALEKAVAKYTARYGIGRVPRPPFWSGYRVLPVAVEFWEHREFRLHQRLRYERSDAAWAATALYP